MRLLVGNFDLEHHLGRGGTRTLPAALQRLNAELACALVAIAQPGDFIWAPELPEAEYAAYLATLGLSEVRFVNNAAQVPAATTIVPWGWSARVVAWGRDNGWHCEAPERAAVTTVNSRDFSASLEQEWNVGLPHARTIRHLQEFHDAIGACPHDTPAWVVKANFGMSARERILGRGSPADQKAVQWVQRQLAENGAVYFEPWVERIDEFGLQFKIPQSGEPILEGITPLLTDHLGTYRGSRFRRAGGAVGRLDESNSVLKIAAQAAQRIQQVGYFGPLGIDAMRYRTAEGEVRWRPLQDINARLTMGRLALGLGGAVADSPSASWLHLQGSDAERSQVSLPKGATAVRTSPLRAGGQPLSRVSYLMTAPSLEVLSAAEQALATRSSPARPGRARR
jgi:hypothetical protein